MNILSVQQPAGLLGVFSLVCADKQGFYEEDEDDLLAELAQGHDQVVHESQPMLDQQEQDGQ